MSRIPFLLAVLLQAVSSQAQTRTSTTATERSAAQTKPTQVDSTDRTAAQYWGLSLDDYRRYRMLMEGIRGAVSDPRISPIEVLGIHARNDAERRQYAQAFARLVVEDSERILLFQAEYDRAIALLRPRLLAQGAGPATRGADNRSAAPASPSPVASPRATNTSLAGGMSRAISVAAGDRLLVFTREGCRDCDDLVRRAMPLALRGVVVDLYLVGARSGDEAQRYARRLALDPAWINDRRVTLNVDDGAFTRALPQQRSLPALVRKRGDSFVQLAESDL